MLSRIQTVFFALGIITIGVLFAADIARWEYTPTDNTAGISIDFKLSGISIVKDVDEAMNNGSIEKKTLQLQLISIAAGLFLVMAIALYKNRALQMKVARLAMFAGILLTGIIAYYCFVVVPQTELNIPSGQLKMIPSVGLFLPLIASVFAFLGYRGVKKDDDLVKSVDRIR